MHMFFCAPHSRNPICIRLMVEQNRFWRQPLAATLHTWLMQNDSAIMLVAGTSVQVHLEYWNETKQKLIKKNLSDHHDAVHRHSIWNEKWKPKQIVSDEMNKEKKSTAQK